MRLGRLGMGALCCAAIPWVGAGGCGKAESEAHGQRMVVIGFDGMDPRVLQRMMDQGRMPHFKKLAAAGGFWKLGTSIPPQSPVAWSNFITGADPGEHGIFDFVHRDPTRQTDPDSPFFSANKTVDGDCPTILFDHAIPMPWQKSSEVILKRGGTPFWKYLEDAGVPSHLFRLPANYPPSPSRRGLMDALSGMGTPDVTGSQGTFQWFSPDFDEHATDDPSGGLTLPMTLNDDGAYVCELQGTNNPILVEWRKDPATGQRIKDDAGKDVFSHPMMKITLFVEPDREHGIVRIRYRNAGPLGMGSDEQFLLREGQWSGWKKLVFPTSALDAGFPAMVRFWLKRAHPPELYASPVNFDPAAPAARVSEPEDFVTRIGDAIGPFYTQGFAEDFKAFDARATDLFGDRRRLFDAEAYRIQSQIVMDERKRLLDFALDDYEDGLLFFYFSSSDLIAHMFWWDPEDGGLDAGASHPTRSPENARKYNDVLLGIYEQCDAQLGKVMDRVGDDTTIIAMSDHGFGPFQRKVNLNTWLYRNGYIAIKPGKEPRGYLAEVADWSRTRAYSIGLNGIYLNLLGRERDGSVKPEERDALLDEISRKLEEATDPDTGQTVVRHMYRTDRVYHGPYAPGGPNSQYTPDLIVGYEYGYITRMGTSGSLSRTWVYPNRNEWSADHCIAADLVPGILVTNRAIRIDDPDLKDLAPTILARFGVAKPESMRGRNLWAPAPNLTASRE